MRPLLAFPAIVCGLMICGFLAPALSAPTGHAILDDSRAFRGRITYIAQRIDTLPAPRIDGVLTIGGNSWSVDERSRTTIATADGRGGTLEGGGVSTGVDDPLASGAIANAWAVALATVTEAPELRPVQGDAIWQVASLRLYLDDTHANVMGLADTAGAGDVSFAFDDWTGAAGMLLPERVMRLRGGVPEASYAIADYAVTRSPSLAAAPAAAQRKARFDSSNGSGAAAAQPMSPIERVDFPWRFVSAAFGALLLALVFVAWTRRDAIVEAVRRHVEQDPRGWQARGVSAFVTADGRMWFDGAEYVIGPQFYGRRAVVQSSPLFLRIGAREVARAVVVPRKFRIQSLRLARSGRSRSAGLSLIDNIVAIGLFSMVVVGAVFPTLVVMANGDRIARVQSDAVQLATNALNDEEIASAYGAVNEGTVRMKAGALTVVVSVGPSQSGVIGAHDIDVAVEDSKGRSLAHAISTVGPAVQPPPPPGHTPNPSPAPSG